MLFANCSLRPPHRRQTHHRRERPQRARQKPCRAYIISRHLTPKRQYQPDDKINQQRAKEKPLTKAVCAVCQAAKQSNPHHIRPSRPEVMRPFELVLRNVAERDPRKVGTSNKSRHPPQRCAAHQVARTVALLHLRIIRGLCYKAPRQIVNGETGAAPVLP